MAAVQHAKLHIPLESLHHLGSAIFKTYNKIILRCNLLFSAVVVADLLLFVLALTVAVLVLRVGVLFFIQLVQIFLALSVRPTLRHKINFDLFHVRHTPHLDCVKFKGGRAPGPYKEGSEIEVGVLLPAALVLLVGVLFFTQLFLALSVRPKLRKKITIIFFIFTIHVIWPASNSGGAALARGK